MRPPGRPRRDEADGDARGDVRGAAPVWKYRPADKDNYPAGPRRAWAAGPG